MSPKDPPQRDNTPGQSDYEQTEEIARIALQVVEADNQAKAKRDDGHFARVVRFLSSVWFIVPALTAIVVVLINLFLFDIPPFYEQARLEQSNSLADQYVEVGNTFLNADELEAAKQEFDKALQLSPGHTAAQHGAFKVDVFLDVTGGEPATASTSIAESDIVRQRLLLLLEEDPGDADVLTYLALMEPNVEKALHLFQRAANIDSEQALAYSRMAEVYQAQEKSDQHVKMAKKAYELAPWKSIFHNNYATALKGNRRDQDAIAEYEDLLYWDPQYLWAYIDLANLYRETGDVQASYSYGRQFIELAADEEVMSANREEQALFDTGPNSVPVHINMDNEKRYFGYYDIAFTCYLLGRTEEAKSYVNKAEAIQIDPYAASEIKRLVSSRTEPPQGESDQFKAKADEFRTQFL